MKAGIWFLAAALAALPARAGDWQAVEQIKSYPVSGQTGAELYEAIGRNGPEISLGMRTIAHTSFKLTWRRNYEPQGGNCVLVSAVPKLIITYVLPKPKGKLPAALQPHWQRFYEGVRAHEKVHGDYIRDLVHAIEAETIGLTVPHVARALCGPDQRWIVLFCAILGPVLLLTADILGRLIAAPAELPTGILCAFVGAPVFIALLRRTIQSR